MSDLEPHTHSLAGINDVGLGATSPKSGETSPLTSAEASSSRIAITVRGPLEWRLICRFGEATEAIGEEFGEVFSDTVLTEFFLSFAGVSAGSAHSEHVRTAVRTSPSIGGTSRRPSLMIHEVFRQWPLQVSRRSIALQMQVCKRSSEVYYVTNSLRRK